MAGHAIEIREQRTWWIKYHGGGRPQCVSSNSEKKEDAKRLLKAREGDVVRGVLITASVGRVSSSALLEQSVNDLFVEPLVRDYERAGSADETLFR